MRSARQIIQDAIRWYAQDHHTAADQKSKISGADEDDIKAHRKIAERAENILADIKEGKIQIASPAEPTTESQRDERT